MFSRTVPYNLRSYALGFQWLILSSVGSMPGPVIFGAFIDKTCNLWEKRCGEIGACLEYNNSQLSYLILAAGLLFQGRNIVSTCFTLWLTQFPPSPSENAECPEEQYNVYRKRAGYLGSWHRQNYLQRFSISIH